MRIQQSKLIHQQQYMYDIRYNKDFSWRLLCACLQAWLTASLHAAHTDSNPMGLLQNSGNCANRVCLSWLSSARGKAGSCLRPLTVHCASTFSPKKASQASLTASAPALLFARRLGYFRKVVSGLKSKAVLMQGEGKYWIFLVWFGLICMHWGGPWEGYKPGKLCGTTEGCRVMGSNRAWCWVGWAERTYCWTRRRQKRWGIIRICHLIKLWEGWCLPAWVGRGSIHECMSSLFTLWCSPLTGQHGS